MNPCAFVNFVSLLACDIAKDKSQDEVAFLAAFFTPVSYTHLDVYKRQHGSRYVL